MRASAAAEAAGVRSVSIITTAFATQARAIGRALGYDLARAQYPGVIATDDADAFRDRVVNGLLPQIEEGLRREQELPDTTDKFHGRQIVASGSLREVHDRFDRELWSDGLPFIPPTVDAVEEFLAYTERDENEQLGRLLPANMQATVWSVAVNGVMAGCDPRMMPLLIGLVELLADPQFRIEDAGSTPGWETLITVNGPAIADLGFRFEGGLMRPGSRPNITTGRFLRLYMRNVAGLLQPPGETDKACIGMNFNAALAENEAAVREAGWPTHAQEAGFGPDDSVVTIQSVRGIGPPIYSSGDDPYNHLRVIAAGMASIFSTGGTPSAIRQGASYPLLVMSPAIMSVLAGSGLTKDDVRDYLADHSRVHVDTINLFGRNSSRGDAFAIERYVKQGLVPEVYLHPDTDGTVPAFPFREHIGIVVAGDPGRNQSRVYVDNHVQGPRMSRKVAPDWRR